MPPWLSPLSPSHLLPDQRGQYVQRIRLAHTIWFSWYSRLPPRPACRRRDLLLLRRRRRRLRPPSSFRAGDREANRKGVHHCRRLRPGRHAVRALADEKNPADDEEERRGQRKDQPEEAARDGTARCASHSTALSRPVFTEVNTSARVHRRESNITVRGSRKLDGRVNWHLCAKRQC